jgi:uncharacterized protein (DUF2141 family)
LGDNHDFLGQIGAVLVYNGTLTGANLTQTQTYLKNFFLKPAPVIGALTASPNPAVDGGKITLSASKVTDGTGLTISSVSFYRESNGKAGLQTGTGGDTLVGTTSTASSGGYSLSAATTGLAAGTYTYYATATDSAAVVSPAVSTTVVLSAPATISGRVFDDANGNGKLDQGEDGLGLWTVFIDTNKDGKLDTGDVSTTTDILGNWSFTGLSAGTYVLRIVPVTGLKTTTPGTAVLTITVALDKSSVGNLFGEESI